MKCGIMGTLSSSNADWNEGKMKTRARIEAAASPRGLSLASLLHNFSSEPADRQEADRRILSLKEIVQTANQPDRR